jgi:hypothetical protein
MFFPVHLLGVLHSGLFTDPTFTDIVSAVLDFVATYSVYVIATVVIGLSFYGLRKALKAGR